MDPGSTSLLSALGNQITDVRAADSHGVYKSNKGGWQSRSDLLERNGMTSCRTLRLLYAALREYILDSIQRNKDSTIDSVQMDIHAAWAGINTKGSYNSPHVHPDSTFSGVLYIKSGYSSENASTQLVFVTPQCPWSSPAMCHHKLSIQAGDVVIFPSWLEHFVPPHLGTQPRIALAFNARIRFKYTHNRYLRALPRFVTPIRHCSNIKA
eukprot:gene155-3546_t